MRIMSKFKRHVSILLIAALMIPSISIIDGSKAAADSPIPTDHLDLWLKADSGLTVDANNRVSIWKDESGNGNDLSVVDPNKKPLLVQDAIYGKPSVRFNDTTSGTILRKQLPASYTGDSTVIMVVKPSVEGEAAKGIFATNYDTGTPGTFAIILNNYVPGRFITFGTYNNPESLNSGYAVNISKADLTTNFYRIGATFEPTFDTAANKGRITTYENNVVTQQLATGNARIYKTYTDYVLGSSYITSRNMKAEVTEVLVYRKVLSSSERTTIDNYLVQKYFTPPVASVNSNYVSGNVLAGTQIDLSTETAGAAIYYTTDGSDPTTSNTKKLYTGNKVTISNNTKIKTYAVKAGMNDSLVATFDYKLAVVPPVAANVQSGALFPGSTITLSSNLTISGIAGLQAVSSNVYYTTDGSDPRTSAARMNYTQPITINQGTTISAYGVLEGAMASSPVTFQYTMTAPSSNTISNLPDSFYNRPGLENMPRIDYSSMTVANVKDFGAIGDGITDDMAAFDHAVDALTAFGGGVLYMPAGTYFFKPLAASVGRIFWNKSGLKNIHFVGDGESTVIRFKMPGVSSLAPGQLPTRFITYDKAPYGWSINGENISVRDFGTTWSPRMDVRGFGSPYNMALTGNGIQAINMSVDQGGIGLVFWQGTNNIWAVDNKVRNTNADSIHFANNVNVTAAYNFIDNGNDDGLAIVSDVNPAYAVSQNNTMINNTVLNANWGRSISVGGLQHLIQGNWVEGGLLAGIFLNAYGQTGTSNGFNYKDFTVKDNTIVRANLNNRADNNVSGNQYGGSIALGQTGTNILVEGNKVYGSEGNGIVTGGNGAFKGKDLIFRNNESIGSTKYGLSFNNTNSQIENLTIANNKLLYNDQGSVNFGTTPITGTTSYSGNVVTQPTNPVKEGFTVTSEQPAYHNVFEGIMREPNQSEWTDVPSIQLPETQINVRDYGATGNGIASDLLAFQEAIAHLPAEGGRLFIPAGTYLLEPVEGQDSVPDSVIKHHLLLAGKNNVHIIGEGDASVLRLTSADHHGVRLLGVTNASVQDIAIELRNQPFLRHNRSLIDVAGSQNVTIQNVTLRNSGGSGIQIDSSTGVSVKNNNIDHVNMNGIAVLASRQVFVEGNHITNSRDNAITVNKLGSTAREPQYIRILGNVIDGVTDQSGIGIASGTQVKVANNTISNTQMAGILLYYTSEAFHANRVEVTNNTLRNTNTGELTYHYGAISVYNSFRGDFLISGNIIENTPYAGIWVDNATLQKLQVEWNTFSGVGTNNIQISAAQLAKIGIYINNVDETAPVTTAAVTPSEVDGLEGWYVHPVTVSLSATDNLSGVFKTEYSLDGGITWLNYADAITIDQDGQYTLSYCSTDIAGNVETLKTVHIQLAMTGPTTTAVMTPSGPDGMNGWYTVPVTMTLSASGKAEYSLNGGDTWQSYNSPISLEQDGVHVINYRSTNDAGKIGAVQTATVNIDKTAPSDASFAADITAPTNTDVILTISYPDDAAVKEFKVGASGTWTAYGAPVVVSANDTVYARGMDTAGNVSNATYYVISNIDHIAPVNATLAVDHTEPTNTGVTVTISYPADAAVKEYKVGESGTWTAYTDPIVVSDNDTVYARGTDAVGNISNVTSLVVSNINKIAPVTVATLSPAAPNGSNSWYTTDVSISLSVSANVYGGAVTTEYQVNDGAWITYTGAIPAFSEGTYKFGYRSKDQAGNVEELKTVEFKVDKTMPALSVQLDKTSIWPANHQMVTINATLNSSDATSGVESVVLTSITSNGLDTGQGDIQANTGTAATSFSLRAEKGRTYTITYTATDKAGNKKVTSVTVAVPHDQSGNH
ncbi:hypothetical protein PAECIP111891_05518 [Paenibacillus allorhizoplanae]|uniref:Uncharacterized protein n=1 Tax=Paenibacillus allorhizoplanae TaxID=2905648 RepID=A0ABM9CTY3_9BACL|nr:chitobiase/beta-hexosaminidase C-terminal domain-containing protein [Paenibacillus allorhizoplanae]CAH1223407.1 hypothetical protein PAECIP111891_05518 [Paenibacillus allorhizoplanae]